MDLPDRVHILEEGPREGFQIEPGPISTDRKIELIEALAHTGLDHIQVVSFVHREKVPGMADAEAVVAGIRPVEGVRYTGLWLNQQGFERARATRKLNMQGSITAGASCAFLLRNQNRTIEQQLASQRVMIKRYLELGVPVVRGSLMAAFGCNFEGDIPISQVVAHFGAIVDLAGEKGIKLDYVSLADTMAWATPQKIKRTIGAIRDRFPDQAISLHLHDTRGQGIANAFAGLEMGVTHFDAAVGGLGGCPFAGHAGAAGNVCTEDLVFMCEEMGIATGIDLDALIECARLAEDIVGHPLPGSVKTGGTLNRMRSRLTTHQKA